MSKGFWESKTFWFFLVYLVTSVAGLFGFADYTPSGDEAEIVGVVVSIVGIALRFLTNRPITLS